MEAIYESSLQVVIQFVYLSRLGEFGKNSNRNSSRLIKASLLFSLWSICSKVISEDKQLLLDKYKKFCVFTDYNILITICRYLWRIFEITSRLFILGFVWSIMGGLTFNIFVFIDVIFLFIVGIVFTEFNWKTQLSVK